ncbi:MAG TPA: hypothetical protein VJ891_16940 [Casimicrobiaceae bacterium]|nr:hypothetical protein [Casimicrobiaceae bacterium]
MATIGPSITLGSVGPGGTREIAYSNAFIVGQTPWGIDGVWQICTSFSQFLRLYGGLSKLSTVAAGTTPDVYGVETNAAVVQCYYAVKGYFDEKLSGSPGVLYFCKVVASASGPTAGALTLSDGASHNTTVTAKWKGMNGNAVFVTVNNPSPTSGAGYAQFIVQQPQANITETWDIANANDAANVSKKSELVTIALPAGGQLPNTSAKQKINAGTPGTADSYSASDSDYVGTITPAGVKTGLQVFNDNKLGSGCVAVPGKFSSTVRSGIATHCATYMRMGLFGSPSGLNLTTVITDLGTQTGPDLAYYWPQIWVVDQNSTSSGQLLVDPVGHIAGLHARMDKEYRGPHKSAAGIRHPLVSALDVERTSSNMELCDDTGSNTLADSLINTIRIKGNPGSVVVWGMRTLSQDNRFRQVPVRRVVQLCYLIVQLTLEGYTFEAIDPFGKLFAAIKGELDTFFFDLRRLGSLYGSQPGRDPRPNDAWFVVCDSSNNPGVALQSGELHADAQFVPTPNAEKISVNLAVTTPGFVGRAQ